MTTTLEPTIKRVPKLPTDRRCDKCNAAAKVQVFLTAEQELAFCGHHASKIKLDNLLPLLVSVIVADDFNWTKLEEHLSLEQHMSAK